MSYEREYYGVINTVDRGRLLKSSIVTRDGYCSRDHFQYRRNKVASAKEQKKKNIKNNGVLYKTSSRIHLTVPFATIITTKSVAIMKQKLLFFFFVPGTKLVTRRFIETFQSDGERQRIRVDR